MAKNILIIEDNRILVELIAEILSKEGYQIFCAYNGEEGIRKAFETALDLIICDFNLPDKNADLVYKELELNSQTQSIPFIFLTGDNSLLFPFNVHLLRKPFTMNQLLEKISIVIN